MEKRKAVEGRTFLVLVFVSGTGGGDLRRALVRGVWSGRKDQYGGESAKVSQNGSA